MLLLALFVNLDYKVYQKLTNEEKKANLYGRSVAYCDSKLRIGVGAEYDGNVINATADLYDGGLYIYDYDPETEKWKLFQYLTPESSETTAIINMGSTIKFSSDCNVLISGAPKSKFKELEQAGAVVVYRLVDGRYKQEQIIVPELAEKDGGFGRGATISSDGKRIAASSTNNAITQLENKGSVEVFDDVDGTFVSKAKLEPPHVLKSSKTKFGQDLLFPTGTTLVVASDASEREDYGTCIYELGSDGVWKLNSFISGNIDTVGTWNNYGKSVTINSDFTELVTGGSQKQFKNGKLFVFKKNQDGWETEPVQVITLGEGQSFFEVFYIGDDALAVRDNIYSTANASETGAVFIYARNDDGKFVHVKTILAPEQFDYQGFGSHIAFSSDYKTVIIPAFNKGSNFGGSKGKHFDSPAVYIYKADESASPPNKKNSNATIIAVCSVVGAIVIIAVIVVSVIYFRRKNERSEKENGSEKV